MVRIKVGEVQRVDGGAKTREEADEYMDASEAVDAARHVVRRACEACGREGAPQVGMASAHTHRQSSGALKACGVGDCARPKGPGLVAWVRVQDSNCVCVDG
jgi:hypothetical protein